MRVVGQVRGGPGHVGGQRAVGLDHLVFLEDVQGRQGGGAGQRVAGIGVRVEEGAQGLVVVVEAPIDGLAGQHRGHRQVATGEGLGQAEEIRGDAGLLAGEHRPGAAEAHRDLVVDQVHAIAVAGFAQQLEVDRVVHAHAAGALDQRFDDDRGDLVVPFGQGALHVGEHVPRMFFPAHAVRTQEAVRAGHLDGVEQQRLVGFGEQRHVAHRHRRDGFAVVAVGQGDEALLARPAAIEPEVVAHLQRDLDARRAAVGVEHPVEPRRGDLHQSLRQLDHRLVAESGEDHVLQLVDLVLDALVDARVGVTEHIDPPGTDRVDVALAFEILQPDAFAAADRDHRQAFVVFHLGTGMPEYVQVALHPVGVKAHGLSPRIDRQSLCNGGEMNNPAGWDTSDSSRRRTPMVAQTALAYAARRCVFAFFLGSPVCR
ncbi:hypothetical protein ALP65_00841 [Pseudomonas aeruginosa]|uniref:Uncharacterized protein n=2 Tax=Pseudomonas aeruginosa TaxID=287 RepID=A0A3M5EAI0_PSEAI|nr:hypothetical protein ALP65_00841 [Pseudomonas aeruginosa]